MATDPRVSHEDIMTKWWLVYGEWKRVVSYERGLYTFLVSKRIGEIKVASYEKMVKREFGRLESADIPKEK